jgi:hypothetical protein
MTYITGNLTVGAYDSDRIVNLGIGHNAIDAGGAYTYFNPTTRQEFSASLASGRRSATSSRSAKTIRAISISRATRNSLLKSGLMAGTRGSLSRLHQLNAVQPRHHRDGWSQNKSMWRRPYGVVGLSGHRLPQPRTIDT